MGCCQIGPLRSALQRLSDTGQGGGGENVGELVKPPAAAFAFAAHAPSVSAGASALVPRAAFGLAAHAPVVSISARADVPAAAFSLAAKAPTIITGATIQVPAAAFGLAAKAPTVDATAGVPTYLNQTNASISSTTSVSFSHTTTSDTDMLVVLVQGYDNGAGGEPTFSGNQTFDGAAMSAGPSVISGNVGYDVRSAIFYLPSPGAKTANIVITFAASVIGRVQAINVENASALDVQGTDNVVTPLSVPLTTTAASIVFGVGMGIAVPAPTFTWSSGVTEIQDLSPSGNLQFGAGYYESAGAESYTFTMTPSAALLAGNLAVAAFR